MTAPSRPVHSTQTPIRDEDRDLYEGPRVTSDGVPIIEVQRGQAPAPNPLSGHKLVDFKLLQMILRGDGEIRYRCANFKNGVSGERCWRDDFTNPRSAVAHINGHGYSRVPDYPIETLRLLTRLVRTFKAAGKRNFSILAAEELNRLGVKTLNGTPWNAEQVSGLFSNHGHKFRMQIRKEDIRRLTTVTDVPNEEEPSMPQQPSQPPAAPILDPRDASLADLDKMSSKLLREATSLFDLHKTFAAEIAEFVELVGAKLAEAAAQPNVDPKVVEDAAKWQKYLEFQKMVSNG